MAGGKRMNFYCTLFDSAYLTRGLALYHSLVSVGEEFQLYILAFDDVAYEMLSKLALPQVTLISMAEFEDDRLLRIKKTRTRGEYCWTCACFSIKYVLEAYQLPEVTYLDADVFFFSRPASLLEEFHASGCDVMITRHRYTREYDQTAIAGKYCVQFMTFKNTVNGLFVLNWWCDRCDEWCYNRVEDGKFGDQKYLDDWMTRFHGIHELSHLGGGVAPWNVQQYTVGSEPSVDGIPVVFFHFHALRLYPRCANLSLYHLSERVQRYFYEPYLSALADSYRFLYQHGFQGFSKGILPLSPAKGLKNIFRRKKRKWLMKMMGRYKNYVPFRAMEGESINDFGE